MGLATWSTLRVVGTISGPNEAFASWLGDKKVVQAWRPAWDAGVRRITQRAGALDADARRDPSRRAPAADRVHGLTSRTPSTGSPDAKGAAVLAMFEDWPGVGTFRDGIRVHLRQTRPGRTRRPA